MHSSSVWVAGTQRNKEKYCTVTLHGSVQSYQKYELLENVDGAARIVWVRWTKFSQPLLGAVYVDKMLVARYKTDSDDKKNTTKKSRYTHYIGTLNSNDNFGSIIYANEVSTPDRGEQKARLSLRIVGTQYHLRLVFESYRIKIPSAQVLDIEK